MAVIADPQGASLCLWQAGRHIGATIRGENNTLCWNELMTTDIETAREFYKGLFGWNLKVSPEYTEINVGSTGIGGMMQITPEMQGMPTAWTPYFCVADADATVDKIKSLGGAGLMGRTKSRTSAASPFAATRRARCSTSFPRAGCRRDIAGPQRCGPA